MVSTECVINHLFFNLYMTARRRFFFFCTPADSSLYSTYCSHFRNTLDRKAAINKRPLTPNTQTDLCVRSSQPSCTHPPQSCQGPESSLVLAPVQTAVRALLAGVWPRPQWTHRTEHWSIAVLHPHLCLKNHSYANFHSNLIWILYVTNLKISPLSVNYFS